MSRSVCFVHIDRLFFLESFHGGIRGSIPLRVTKHGRLAQLGERLDHTQEVAGSSPASPTIPSRPLVSDQSGLAG